MTGRDPRKPTRSTRGDLKFDLGSSLFKKTMLNTTEIANTNTSPLETNPTAVGVYGVQHKTGVMFQSRQSKCLDKGGKQGQCCARL